MTSPDGATTPPAFAALPWLTEEPKSILFSFRDLFRRNATGEVTYVAGGVGPGGARRQSRMPPGQPVRLGCNAEGGGAALARPGKEEAHQ